MKKRHLLARKMELFYQDIVETTYAATNRPRISANRNKKAKFQI